MRQSHPQVRRSGNYLNAGLDLLEIFFGTAYETNRRLYHVLFFSSLDLMADAMLRFCFFNWMSNFKDEEPVPRFPS